MRQERDPETSPHAKHDAVSPADARHIFREMIKAEIEAHPLTRGRRWELLAFAPHLDIPRSEANLLIRAVEIELQDGAGTTLASSPATEHPVDSSYLADSEQRPISLLIALAFLSLLLAGSLLAGIPF